MTRLKIGDFPQLRWIFQIIGAWAHDSKIWQVLMGWGRMSSKSRMLFSAGVSYITDLAEPLVSDCIQLIPPTSAFFPYIPWCLLKSARLRSDPNFLLRDGCPKSCWKPSIENRFNQVGHPKNHGAWRFTGKTVRSSHGEMILEAYPIPRSSGRVPAAGGFIKARFSQHWRGEATGGACCATAPGTNWNAMPLSHWFDT